MSGLRPGHRRLSREAGTRVAPRKRSADSAAIVVAAGRSRRLPGPVAEPWIRVAGDSILGHVIATLAHGAAIAASRVVDTLKEASGGRIVRTVDREALWRAETPQGFRRTWLAEGLAAAERDGVTVTDDAMLVERTGREVRIVESTAP